MKKRIGIACNVLGFSGGMERYAIDIAMEFVSRGDEVVFYAKKVDEKLREQLGVEAQICHCGFIPLKLQPLYFSKWLESRADEVDVMIACCRTSAANVYVCGGTHIGFLKSTNKQYKWYDKLYIGLERRAYTNARLIVSHSELMTKELISLYGVDKKKIFTAYPPVSGENFSRASVDYKYEMRKKLGIACDAKAFLFVSSSHERKGYPLLEEYFSKTNLPILLLVAGRPIPSENKHIRYIGYRKDIADLYKAVDYTILASTYEPFGLVGVESVLCGTPVVLANNIGCCDVISDVAKATFKAGDLNSLDQAIRSILNSPVTECGSEQVSSPTSVAAHVDLLEKALQNYLF